jgi:hypothetical protein
MTQMLKLPAPVVRRAGRFEENDRRLALREEREELRSREPVAFGDLTRLPGNGDLEDVLVALPRHGDHWRVDESPLQRALPGRRR